MKKIFLIFIILVSAYYIGGCASNRIIVELPSFLTLAPGREVSVSNRTKNLFLELLVIGKTVARIGPGETAIDFPRCMIQNAVVPMMVRAYSDPYYRDYVGAASYSQNCFYGHGVRWEVSGVEKLGGGYLNSCDIDYQTASSQEGKVEMDVPSVTISSVTVFQALNNTEYRAVVYVKDSRGEKGVMGLGARGGFDCYVLANYYDNLYLSASAEVKLFDSSGIIVRSFSHQIQVSNGFPLASQLIIN